MFLSAIEEKRQQDLKVERENKFGTKVLQTYHVLKCQMEKMTKEKIRQARQNKINAAESLGIIIKIFNNAILRVFLDLSNHNLIFLVKKVTAKIKQKNEFQDEVEDKLAERLELQELEKIAEQKRKKEKMRQEMIEQQKICEENKATQKKEDKDLLLWEMQQRYYRDQFYKNWGSQQNQNEKNKRLAYGKLLKIQMVR